RRVEPIEQRLQATAGADLGECRAVLFEEPQVGEPRQVERDVIAHRDVAPRMFRADGAEAALPVPVENFEHLGLARGLVAERFPGLVAAEIGLTGLHRYRLRRLAAPGR